MRLQDRMETLLARHGAQAVIEALSDAAYAKAEHSRANLQDGPLSAAAWERFLGIHSAMVVTGTLFGQTLDDLLR